MSYQRSYLADECVSMHVLMNYVENYCTISSVVCSHVSQYASVTTIFIIIMITVGGKQVRSINKIMHAVHAIF